MILQSVMGAFVGMFLIASSIDRRLLHKARATKCSASGVIFQPWYRIVRARLAFDLMGITIAVILWGISFTMVKRLKS